MPEGPEIRREADRISKKIVGKEVHSVNLIYPPIAEFQDILQQSQIESIERLQNPKYEVSCHYLISRNGSVIQM